MRGFIALLIVISTLFFIVMVKMEIRRKGYQLLHLQRTYTRQLEDYRAYRIQLASTLKPDYVREYAKQFLELDWAKSKQIIYLTGRELRDHDLDGKNTETASAKAGQL